MGPFFESLEPRQLLSAATLLSAQFNIRGPVTGWSADTSYLGRTQLSPTRVEAMNGVAKLTISSYNPTGLAFCGQGIISDAVFTPQAGTTLVITVRAKLDGPIAGGLVGGIFLYPQSVVAGSNQELDFELASNQVANGQHQVETNVYADEPLGAGHPLPVALPRGGQLTGWHTYQMKLDPGVSTTWLIDGKVVRTQTAVIPSGPLQLRMNLWAPGPEWDWAYSAAINPVSEPTPDAPWTMRVDYATVKAVQNPVTIAGLSIQLDTVDILQQEPIVGNGTISAVGYGRLNYRWMVQRPDGLSVAVSRTFSANVDNGDVTIAPFTLPPTRRIGDHHVWVRAWGGTSVGESNVVDFAVLERPATIAITYVPASSVWGVSLRGRVTSLNVTLYKVAVYINLSESGSWWNKPYESTPGTAINAYGGWSCRVTTGGMDDQAIAFRAYLLPKGLDVPIVLGGTLPAELDGYLFAEATR